ncbi:hypothetical protein O1611_g9218 [Lasiodiplodia mahajangana]|uniref:Uncharacterized protein n=1 Tax=Lasiodiplodia mahajangana TaxID=1108764 RepID=A0ACC2JAW5_9PEZI|nr:hypothetical protein O1611_g9218 [Lasiodiplodia mahajangana]
MLSKEDAKELIESGAPINSPIFVSTPNLVNWTASDPLTAFFEEYSPDQMKWTVDVQTPLKLRTNADETASRMTIGQLYERFRCEGTEYLNALELANPIPSSDPEFLRGVNSRVYHRALHRCASEGKAGRTRVTDGRHWALVGQSGALSPPHEDWGGKDTFITCQRSRIGYGWFSDLSDDDRKAWHLSRQICPSQARFRVLNRSETVFFPAGTIHFVFRLVLEPHTVAFSGFNFRWSGLHNSAQVMLNQLKHPEITNEDVTNSDLLLWTEIANMVENESSPKRLEYLGGEEGRKRTQTHCSVTSPSFRLAHC